MSEAIISRRGRTTNSSSNKILASIIFVENNVWTVPKAVDQQFDVMIFGGGGGASSNSDGSGGGGGYMNNDTLQLSQGSLVTITLGAGGVSNSSNTTGGTTSFGTYLSANGGTVLNGGSGGGGGRTVSTGGIQFGRVAGSGTQFGGGGPGGNGGIYGGGGGGVQLQYTQWYSIWEYIRAWTAGDLLYQRNTTEYSNVNGGIGGTYGGNGSRSNTGENGTNTIGLLNGQYEGPGLGGKGANYISGSNKAYAGGGGGGYGGCGGGPGGAAYSNSEYNIHGNVNAQYRNVWINHVWYGYVIPPGGGGGYGANGGNGASRSCSWYYGMGFAGGGGGGYTGKGGDAYGMDDCVWGGGGGGYGKGAGGDGPAGYAGGGSGNYNGGNGVCIVQYYTEE